MFPAQAEILMADGTRKTHAKVKKGDFVLSHTGHSRQVLGVKANPYSGKLLKFDAGGRNWITCTECTRFYFTLSGKVIYQSSMVDTGVREKILTIPFPTLSRLNKRKEGDAVYWTSEMTRVRECQFRPAKSETIYSLDVEEEHSYLIVGYAGSIVIPTKG